MKTSRMILENNRSSGLPRHPSRRRHTCTPEKEIGSSYLCKPAHGQPKARRKQEPSVKANRSTTQPKNGNASIQYSSSVQPPLPPPSGGNQPTSADMVLATTGPVDITCATTKHTQGKQMHSKNQNMCTYVCTWKPSQKNEFSSRPWATTHQLESRTIRTHILRDKFVVGARMKVAEMAEHTSSCPYCCQRYDV